MLAFRRQNKAASPEKELHKLKRQDLLELLLEQMKDNSTLQTQMAEDQAYIDSLGDLTNRLKGKLDQKDEQIQMLRERLDQKDALIEALHEQVRNIAGAEKRSERLAALVEFEDLMVQANWGRYVQTDEPAVAEATAEAADAAKTAESTEAATAEPAETLETAASVSASADTADAAPAAATEAPEPAADTAATPAATPAAPTDAATPHHLATPEEVA